MSIYVYIFRSHGEEVGSRHSGSFLVVGLPTTVEEHS